MKPKRLTKAQQMADERDKRQGISPDLLMGYCERCDLWHEWDKVWADGRCPNCGGKPSNRHGYQITTSRTWNSFQNRPKIKKKFGIM